MGASKERMVWKMSDIQKALELEGMLLRAAEEKLLALEAKNAALRELLQEARLSLDPFERPEVCQRIDAARKE